MSKQQENNAQNPSPFVAVAVLLLFLVGGAVAYFAFGGKDHSSGHDKPGHVHNENGEHAHDANGDHTHDEEAEHAHDANGDHAHDEEAEHAHDANGDHAHDGEADHAHEDGDHDHDVNTENTGV